MPENINWFKLTTENFYNSFSLHWCSTDRYTFSTIPVHTVPILNSDLIMQVIMTILVWVIIRFRIQLRLVCTSEVYQKNSFSISCFQIFQKTHKCGSILLAQPGFASSVISSFFTQNKGALGPFPRSITGIFGSGPSPTNYSGSSTPPAASSPFRDLTLAKK